MSITILRCTMPSDKVELDRVDRLLVLVLGHKSESAMIVGTVGRIELEPEHFVSCVRRNRKRAASRRQNEQGAPHRISSSSCRQESDRGIVTGKTRRRQRCTAEKASRREYRRTARP
jgi:hypothetical protein